MFKTQLQIGGNTLDFFDDEHINLSTSIDDAIELATSLTSFTKEFTVPATHINNTILKNLTCNAFNTRFIRTGAFLLAGTGHFI